MKRDRLTDEHHGASVLKNSQWGVLSMVTPQGEAYGVPLNYWFDETRRALYFHGALEGTKMDCLAAHAQASFCAVGNDRIVPELFTTDYDSAIARGKVSVVTDMAQKQSALISLTAHLCSGIPPPACIDPKGLEKVCILRMDIETLEGKRNRHEPA